MHDLFGLTASSPIGFMAALGMVRVLTSDRGCKIRLGWRNGHAVIKGIEPKGAISELTANMDNRAKALEFNWADSPRKVTPEKYRLACHKMDGDRRALETQGPPWEKLNRVNQGSNKGVILLLLEQTKCGKKHFEPW